MFNILARVRTTFPLIWNAIELSMRWWKCALNFENWILIGYFGRVARASSSLIKYEISIKFPNLSPLINSMSCHQAGTERLEWRFGNCGNLNLFTAHFLSYTVENFVFRVALKCSEAFAVARNELPRWDWICVWNWMEWPKLELYTVDTESSFEVKTLQKSYILLLPPPAFSRIKEGKLSSDWTTSKMYFYLLLFLLFSFFAKNQRQNRSSYNVRENL